MNRKKAPMKKRKPTRCSTPFENVMSTCQKAHAQRPLTSSVLNRLAPSKSGWRSISRAWRDPSANRAATRPARESPSDLSVVQ